MTRAIIKALANAAFFILISSASAYAGEVVYSVNPDNVTFTVLFNQGYSSVEALKNASEVVIAFETTEDIIFEKQNFFDMPLSAAWLTAENSRKRLYFTFENTMMEPVVTRQPKSITIVFTSPTVGDPSVTPVPVPSPLPGIGTYVRMLFGIVLVIAFILGAYYLMKFFFKSNITTDIPGSGRLLGKVDLDIKKSLVFYELGEIIYILGTTDSGISLIDKITDPVDVNQIKAGFSKRKDFSSYLKFFRKSNEIKTDIDDSSALIEEKLKSLRKK